MIETIKTRQIIVEKSELEKILINYAKISPFDGWTFNLNNSNARFTQKLHPVSELKTHCGIDYIELHECRHDIYFDFHLLRTILVNFFRLEKDNDVTFTIDCKTDVIDEGRIILIVKNIDYNNT